MESYFDPKHPASFGGVDNFRKHLDKKFTGKQIRDWMLKKDAYYTYGLVQSIILCTSPYARTLKDE